MPWYQVVANACDNLPGGSASSRSRASGQFGFSTVALMNSPSLEVTKMPWPAGSGPTPRRPRPCGSSNPSEPGGRVSKITASAWSVAARSRNSDRLIGSTEEATVATASTSRSDTAVEFAPSRKPRNSRKRVRMTARSAGVMARTSAIAPSAVPGVWRTTAVVYRRKRTVSGWSSADTGAAKVPQAPSTARLATMRRGRALVSVIFRIPQVAWPSTHAEAAPAHPHLEPMVSGWGHTLGDKGDEVPVTEVCEQARKLAGEIGPRPDLEDSASRGVHHAFHLGVRVR